MSKPTFANVVASSYNIVASKSVAAPIQNCSVNPSQESNPSLNLNGQKQVARKEDIIILPNSTTNDPKANLSPTAVKSLVESVRVEDLSAKLSSNDDGSTQISSDGSAKPPSFDTKSVTSGTTFAMDENASLRPDDSASIRAAAVEDDDLISAPGSVIAGSRVGSDLGAKAFREQLHEIANNMHPLRGADSGSSHLQGPALLGSARFPASQPGDTLPLLAVASPNMPPGVQPPLSPPDEKLLEALQSPRDRVFVLKLEQDIIDFIEQSKESTLALPKFNGFYRMLAHKLADYYRLDHSVEHTPNGAAVIINRTTFCKLAPPLSGLPNPSASNTPPLVIQARKIMRRPDEPKTSETSTAANSEGPSAAASEVDGDNGMADPSHGPGSDSKARTALTREEREAKYAEVRERIFGKVEEGSETNDTGVGSDDNEDSRASSTTGKKKTVNKQRNLSNDDFEPRSQFYGSNSVSNGYSNDQFYYQTYPTAHQHSPYPMQQANGNQSMSYVPGYPTPGPVDPQPQYWQNSQYQMQPPVVNMGNYPQLQNTAYDLSSHFNASMQSFQAAPPNGHFPGKIPPPMMSPYPQQPPPNQWTQPSYEHSYQYPRPGYSSAGAADRAVPPSSAMMQPQVQYPYGQYPMAPPNPMAPKSFIPGNQHRPQFNPQIQSFVPGGPSQRSMGMQPNVTPYGPPAGVSLPMQPMNRPAVAQNQPDNRHPSSQRPAATSTPIPNTAAQNVVMNQDASTATPPNSSSSPPSTSVGAKPVLEITAKWGTPAHLPPKPPPPESMEPHKYMEINKGLHQQFPGLPRLSSNGYGNNGFNGNGSNRFGP